MGRPELPIDWRQVEYLCGIRCTAEDICHILGVSPDTLSRRCLKEYGITFAEYSEQKGANSKATLRRVQLEVAVGRKAVYDKEGRLIQTALAPNPTMLIFLGKNWLGQRDVWEADIRNNVHVDSVVLDPYREFAEMHRLYGKEVEEILGTIVNTTSRKALTSGVTKRGNGNGVRPADEAPTSNE